MTSSFTENWLIYPKLAYLTMSMALYSTYVYTPAYFEAVWKVPTHGYGYISAISVLSLSGSLLWSRLGERLGRVGGMMYVCAILYAALFGALWLEMGAQRMGELMRMVTVAAFYGGSSAFGGALSPLLDHLVLEYLERHARYTKDIYGRQRLWSSIGHALIVAVNGWGIQKYGYDSMFLCLLVSTGAFLVSSLLLQANIVRAVSSGERFIAQEDSGGDKEDGRLQTTSASQSTVVATGSAVPASQSLAVRGSLLKLLGHPSFVFFITNILVAGFVRCVVGAFGPVYFKKVLQMRESVYGLAMQIRLLPEMLCFFYGSAISSRYGSDSLMLIGHLAGIMRSAIYAITSAGPSHFWVIYPAELLKGVNNAAIMMAGPRLAHDIAPLGEGATALAIFHGVYGSLAMIMAGLIGGQVLQVFGDTAPGFKNLFMITTLSGLIPIVAIVLLRLRRQ